MNTPNKISSTQKGNLYEDKVFSIIEKILNNDEFYVNKKFSKIYRKKKYFSRERNAHIIFDVTIETFVKDANEYSHLTVIECKDLKRTVSIEDIEEFDSKIRQVGEHNTKGVIVTRIGFTTSAFNFARAKGIMLILLADNNEYKWVNYRKNKQYNNVTIEQAEKKFTEPTFFESFLAFFNDGLFAGFPDLFIEAKIIDCFFYKDKLLDIPYLPIENIEDAVQRIAKHKVYGALSLDSDKFCRFLKEHYPTLDFDFDSDLPDEVLGKIEFQPLKIFIANKLSNDVNRWRFTLAHEAGHLIFHLKLLIEKLLNKTEDDSTISFKSHISEQATERLEYQANLFASCLLLPTNTFRNYVHRYFLSRQIHKGHLYLDSQPCNMELAYALFSAISKDFGVSMDVARIRLKNLDLLIDKTDISIKSVFKGMQF